jgi:hypothetical protein
VQHETGETLDRPCTVTTVLQAESLEPFITFYQRYGHFTGMSACVARTDRARAIGGFDPALPRRHDVDFWMRLIDGESWVFDPEPTTLYQLGTPGALSADVVAGTLHRLEAFGRHAARLRGRPVFDEFMARLARRALRQTFREPEARVWREILARSDPFLPSRTRLGWRLVRALPRSRKLLAAMGML